jgi:dolichol-phosphate mannosyltransferase
MNTLATREGSDLSPDLKEQRPTISFVLPAHNEERNVAGIAARLAEIAAPLGCCEILFVDDGSTDGTLAAIRSLARQDPAIRYVSFTRNFGHQAALRAGLRHARGAAVVLMDSDFEHPPEVVPALVAEWRKGTRIVLTRRHDSAERTTPFKRISSRLFYRLFESLGDVQIEAGSADFMLLDRATVDIINQQDDQDIFLRGLVRWLGIPYATVPYVQGLREAGETKYTIRRMVDFAVTGIIAHSIKPLRLTVHLALIFALIGLLLLIYSIVSFLWVRHTVAGWSSLMAVMAILGAGQFLVLGILGEYVGRILRETRRWPIYIVAETEAGEFVAPLNAAAGRSATAEFRAMRD